MGRQRLPRLGGDPAGDDELVGRGDQDAFPVGQSLGVGTGEDPRLYGGVEATAAGQPTVLLQLVLAAAQVPDPQDHDLGVAPGQLARVQQVPGERQPGQEQQPVLTQHVHQAEPRPADTAGAELGDDPVQRTEFLDPTGRDTGGCTHGCLTR